MKKTDFDRFHEIMDVLANAINSVLSEKREAIYFRALIEFGIDEIARAADSVMRTWRIANTFPPIAEFISLLEANDEEGAHQAWYRYLSALDHPGYRASIDFGDPFLNATVSEMNLW